MDIFRETVFLSTRLSCQIAKFNPREICHFHVPKTQVSAEKVTMLEYLFHHNLSYMLLVGNEGKTERVIIFFSEPVEVEEVTQSQG